MTYFPITTVTVVKYDYLMQGHVFVIMSLLTAFPSYHVGGKSEVIWFTFTTMA